MQPSPEDVLLAEAGFKVVREGVENTFFVTPGPCTRRLYKQGQAACYLAREHQAGRLLNIAAEMFIFRKRKRGVRKEPDPGAQAEPESVGNHGAEDAGRQNGDMTSTRNCSDRVSFMVQQLTRDPTVTLDHKKLLSNAASMMDAWLSRSSSPSPGQADFIKFKDKLLAATDFESLLTVLYGDPEVRTLLCGEMTDIVIAEIAKIDSTQGPLSDFPPSVNSNIFVKIVEFGMEKCPRSLELLANVAIRSRKSIMPKDVLTVASMFASLCYIGNQNLDGLVKMRSFMLQAGGTTDQAMDILSDMGLAKTSRSLNNLKDVFAEVGPRVILNTNYKLPSQSALDNIDYDKEHMMLKVTMREQVDTSHLSTVPLPKAEAVKLINKSLLMVNSLDLRDEKNHLVEEVLANGWGLRLAERREDRAGKLAKFLPRHHRHSLSNMEQLAAIYAISKMYPCQETRHSHMIQLAFQVQREHLEEVGSVLKLTLQPSIYHSVQVAEFMEREPDFMADLALLEQVVVEQEVRSEAERRVQEANLKYGEKISHGDLMTVEMIQEIRQIVAQEITAFGRLEFFGLVRVQGLHMKMKKTVVDYKALMKSSVNFDDKLCMAQLCHRAGKDKEIFNDKEKIHKNDSSFERHVQWSEELAIQYGLNMFDNFDRKHPEVLDAVHDEESSTQYILRLWDEYDVVTHLFYDPTVHDPTQKTAGCDKQGEDDMWIYCRESFDR